MRKALYKAEILVVLPLTLAVLLASMCLPVTCTAETMAKNACPECASAAQHPTGLTMTMHVAMNGMPAGHQMPSKSAPCNHSTTSNIQASSTGAPVQIASLAAPVIPAPVPVTVVRPAVRVAEAPPGPTGLVLTASQLRI